MTRSFFDLKGKPIWYSPDNKWFYSYVDHKPAAFSEMMPIDPKRFSIFAPVTGEYLGWCENGWIYNRSGNPWMYAAR